MSASGDFPLHITFYTQGLPFTGSPIAHQSLGGSESAVWFMARALAKRGHKVEVFCRCPHPGVYNAVTYRDVSEFGRRLGALEADLFIACRFYQVLALELRTKLNWLWLHDMPGNSAPHLAAHCFQTDQILTLSAFHSRTYAEAYAPLEPLIWQTRNGVDLEQLRQYGVAGPQRKRLLWAARPERGLDYLLTEIWPRLLKEDPELELQVCGYDMRDYEFPDELKTFYAYCQQLVKQSPRTVDNGALNKADYYRLLSSAGVFVYPTAFPEVSCINALEAMALGIPVVTTDTGALSETVPYERIPGLPHDPDYAERFCEQVLRLIRQPLLARQRTHAGREWVRKYYNWEQVAVSWQNRAFELLRRRQEASGRRIVQALLWNSDVVTAQRAALQIGDPDLLRDTQEILAAHHQNPDDYHAHASPSQDWSTATNARFRAILSMLPAPQEGKPLAVTDLGCGSGALLAHILRSRSDIEHALGIDFSAALILTAQGLADQHGLSKRLSFLCEDVLSQVSQHEPGTADIVLAGEILEHCPDYRALITAAEAHAKEGGFILFTVPSGAWESYSFSQPKEDFQRYHVHHFERRDLEEIFGLKADFHLEYVPGHQGARGDLLGWWIVTYRAAAHRPTGLVNVQRKILTTRPRPMVAACLIVKNEEDNIVRCLKSVQDVVDEIWVWDCGSVDRTVELAEKLGTAHYPPVYIRHLDTDPDGDGLGNFGAWRNQSISQTGADWILWLDADEILVSGRNLRKYVTFQSLFNAYVIRQNHVQLRAGDPLDADEPQRLFRHGKGYQFYGCLHEQPAVSLNQEIQPALQLPDCDILHYGYLTQEQARYKCVARNLPLLRKDRLRYPLRELGPLLSLRDYLNLAQLHVEDSGGQLTDQIVQYLRSSVELYLQFYAAPTHKYHAHALKYAQQALRFLGQRGVAVRPEWGVPFEVKLLVLLGVGGLQGNGHVPQLNSRWFASTPEFLRFLEEEGKAVVAPLARAQGLGPGPTLENGAVHASSIVPAGALLSAVPTGPEFAPLSAGSAEGRGK